MRPLFPFARPELPPPASWLGHLEISYAERWFSNGGPLVRRLEDELAARDRASGRAAVVTASATAGLVGALLALDVRGPVALPSFTFPATAHAVELAGCTPVLCDVDAETWELSPEAAAAAVREHHCAAIIHVRSFGLCRDLRPIEDVAAATGVPLIVDSAAAFGGETTGRVPAGRAGTAEVFSFHATKVFAAGEGGAVLAPPELTDAIRHASNFALAGTDVTSRGLNGKMSELTAAVALAMLERLEAHVAARAHMVAALLAAAEGSGLAFEPPHDPGRPPWQGLPLLLQTADVRERVLAGLRRAGIEARPYYAPGLHRTRAFAGRETGQLTVTENLSERVLCLPVYSRVAPEELVLLTTALHGALTAARAHDRGLSRR